MGVTKSEGPYGLLQKPYSLPQSVQPASCLYLTAKDSQTPEEIFQHGMC